MHYSFLRQHVSELFVSLLSPFISFLRTQYYECGLNSDAETLNSLLKLAFEEAFKSTLLTYALLLRPSESKLFLSVPITFGRSIFTTSFYPYFQLAGL